MYCKCLIILSLCFGALPIWGQSITRTVVGNLGTYTTNPTVGSLHYTLGEANTAYNIGIDDNILEVGFHYATYELIVNTVEIAAEWELNVFPNPTTEWLKIRSPQALDAQILLYNSAGQLTLEKPMVGSEAQLNVQRLPAGVYVLRIQASDGSFISLQVVKAER